MSLGGQENQGIAALVPSFLKPGDNNATNAFPLVGVPYSKKQGAFKTVLVQLTSQSPLHIPSQSPRLHILNHSCWATDIFRTGVLSDFIQHELNDQDFLYVDGKLYYLVADTTAPTKPVSERLLIISQHSKMAELLDFEHISYNSNFAYLGTKIPYRHYDLSLNQVKTLFRVARAHLFADYCKQLIVDESKGHFDLAGVINVLQSIVERYNTNEDRLKILLSQHIVWQGNLDFPLSRKFQEEKYVGIYFIEVALRMRQYACYYHDQQTRAVYIRNRLLLPGLLAFATLVLSLQFISLPFSASFALGWFAAVNGFAMLCILGEFYDACSNKALAQQHIELLRGGIAAWLTSHQRSPDEMQNYRELLQMMSLPCDGNPNAKTTTELIALVVDSSQQAVDLLSPEILKIPHDNNTSSFWSSVKRLFATDTDSQKICLENV